MPTDKNIQWLEDLAKLLREEIIKLDAEITRLQSRIIMIEDFVTKIRANINDLKK